MVEDSLEPESIHLPSIYIQRVVKGERFDKVIEVKTHTMLECVPFYIHCLYIQRLTTRKRGQESTRFLPRTDREKQRDKIIRRAALEFHDGMYGA